MKKAITLLVLLITISAYAIDHASWPSETQFSWSGKENFPNPSIEIRNREKYELEVTVIQGNSQQKFTLPANKSSFFESKIPVIRIREIDPLQETRIDIVYEPKKGNGYLFKNYTVPAGKKAFVSWENHALRPQRGSFGKTQSGISLKKDGNITQQELLEHMSEGKI